MHPHDPQKLLSIAVPTLNRCQHLQTTLPLLLEQVAHRTESIQFLVIDNFSDDGTEEFMRKIRAQYPFVEYLRFTTRTALDGSFERCVDHSSGRYINIFGDDDIPLPGYLDTLLDILANSAHCDIVYVNRLIGNEALDRVAEIGHPEMTYGHHHYSSRDFIRRFTHWPGFITSLTFSRNAWENGRNLTQTGYEGYRFLARVYFGIAGGQCLFIGAPLMIQRRGLQAWKSEWPRYWLVSMPHLLADLESHDVTSGALAAWQNSEVNARRIVIDCIVAKVYGYRVSDPFWQQAMSYQSGGRKWLISLCRYLMPKALAAFIYFRFSKYREAH